MLDLYHAEPVANSTKSLLCLSQTSNSYSMVAGVPRKFPEIMNPQATPLACTWLDTMNARPAMQAALSMPNKVPEVLRTFGG